MSGKRRFISAAFLLFAFPAAADPPPIAAYAGLQISSARLSPDGNTIAMIAPVRDRQALVTRAIDGDKTVAIPTGEYFPDWFQWKSSSRLLASVRFSTDLPTIGTVIETRMVFFDADGGNGVPARVRRTTDFAVTIGNQGNRVPQIQDRVVSLLPGDPDHVLMAVTPESDFLHPELLKIDIHTGYGVRVQPALSHVTDFFTDGDEVARAAIRIDRESWRAAETRLSVIGRTGRDADWKTINEVDFNHQLGRRLVPLGFAPGMPDLLYVLTEGEGGRLVGRAYDLASGTFGPVLAADPHCDAAPLMHDYQVVGFHIPCGDVRSSFFDPAWQHDWDIATKALKTNLISIIDRSEEGKRTLLTVQQTTTSPESYWLIDRRGSNTNVRWIGEAYAKIPRDQIAEARPVAYKARDGLTIPALLTLPAGAPSGPIPFVVLPHGGPTAHDDIRFDWIAQFLASRGYGVFQPQFRGSDAYGAAFQEAGYGQWGLAMQDDVTDGTRWLIDRKLADPARICIAGGSYGGYAALMGVVKEPGLYACAAAFAPVTDIDLFLRRQQKFAFKDINVPRITDDKQDTDVISPSENAGKIRVPVLLMHGVKDFTVPVEQSEVMERALKRAGKPVEAVYLDGADHYFSQGSDRVAWLTGLEKLLAAAFSRPDPAKAAP